jgi:hypothetical protein
MKDHTATIEIRATKFGGYPKVSVSEWADHVREALKHSDGPARYAEFEVVSVRKEDAS